MNNLPRFFICLFALCAMALAATGDTEIATWKGNKKAISNLGGKKKEVIEVEIEDSDLNHNLVVIKKIKNTPKQYPRKAGSITKKPIA